MNFKFDEIDELEEENIEPSEENTGYEEFSDSDFDDSNDEEESEQNAYVPVETIEEHIEDEKDDEDEIEDKTPSLVVPHPGTIAPFNEKEENNTAYSEAVKAFYEKRNYEEAIEKFNQAIINEKNRKKNNQSESNEVIAKSMYWQAEAYVKIQDYSKAINTLESLVENCNQHYLTISAQRRAEMLKAKHI